MDQEQSETAPSATPARRIERARCIELGIVLSIDEAREAFLREGAIEQFHFECAETACKHLGVRIAGVNYRFNAQLAPKLVANHFRRLDDHDPACPYHSIARSSGLDAHHSSARRSHALRRDLIEEFLPPTTMHSNAGSEPWPAPAPMTAMQAPRRRRAQQDRFACTSSLCRLVDTYRSLVASQVPNAVRDHVIRVHGIGPVSIGSYFTPVYRAGGSQFPHVIYGGVRLEKRYGHGFKLRFIDRYQGAPTSIYVAPAIASDAHGWSAQLQLLEDGGWCTAYALGQIASRPGAMAFSIDVAIHAHLHLHTPQRVRPATTAAQENQE